MKPTLQNLYQLQAVLEDVPKLLTVYRKSQRITQEELANELGLTANSISADEQGRYQNAGLDRLLQVINALIRLSNRKTTEENKHEPLN
jgi:predicted transcriptional regulator